MTMFDLTINVSDATVKAPTLEELENGALPLAVIVVTPALLLPLVNPQTGQPLILPAGAIKLPMTRPMLETVVQEAEAALAVLPAPENRLGIPVASSMSEVDAVAREMGGLR